MSQEKKLAQTKSLLSKNEPIEHEIVTSEDEIFKVWIKQLSFMDVIKASSILVTAGKEGLEMNVEAYYKHAFSSWITKSEPTLNKEELLTLNSDVGAQICAILPNSFDILGMVNGGFTKQNPKD